MTKQNLLLGDFLVSQGLISESELRLALKHQKEKGKMLGRSLIELELIKEQDMIKALSEHLGVQYVSLKTYRIDPEVIKLVPEHIARCYQVLPLFRIDATLTVGMVNPLDVTAIDAITRASQLKVAPMVCSELEVREAIEHHYGHATEHAQAASANAMQVIHVEQSNEALTTPEEDASLTKMVETMLLSAMRNNARQIHLESTAEGFLVRYRIDGRLQAAMTQPQRLAAPLISWLRKQADLANAEFGTPQHGRLTMRLEEETIEAGVSIVPAARGESVVLHLSDRSRTFRLEELGLPPAILDALSATFTRLHGLLVIASPAGHGRTATLYALLRALRSADKNLVTIEEAVEQIIEGCRQMQISVKNGMSFAAGFNAALLQDPDVIMVSHLREEETAHLAVNAALDGKLVLIGLSAHEATEAVVRLLDMAIKPNLLAATLRGVLALRLVRKICEQCKFDEPASPEIRRMLPRLFDQPVTVYRGRGCAACQGTGYRGRALLAEFLSGNEAIQSQLRNMSTTGLVSTELKKHQIGSLFQEGIEKMLQGVTTWEEVVRVGATS